MRRLRIVPAVLLVTLGLAACSTTIDGTGTRVGGAPSATDFPSPSESSSPTDSPTGTDSPTSSPTGDDASDLVDQMVEAMTTREQGFTMRGKSDDDGQTVTLDLRMATDSGQGTLTFDDDVCELINDGGDGYAKAPAAFWKDEIGVDDDVATQVDNKWVELSGDADFLKTFVDASTFLDLATSGSDYTLGDTTTKQGVDVVGVESDGSTLYISTDEPHLLIEVDDTDGPIAFGFPDDDLTVTAPSGAIPFPE